MPISEKASVTRSGLANIVLIPETTLNKLTVVVFCSDEEIKEALKDFAKLFVFPCAKNPIARAELFGLVNQSPIDAQKWFFVLPLMAFFGRQH